MLRARLGVLGKQFLAKDQRSKLKAEERRLQITSWGKENTEKRLQSDKVTANRQRKKRPRKKKGLLSTSHDSDLYGSVGTCRTLINMQSHWKLCFLTCLWPTCFEDSNVFLTAFHSLHHHSQFPKGPDSHLNMTANWLEPSSVCNQPSFVRTIGNVLETLTAPQ